MRVWLVGRTAADDVEELAEVFPSVTFTGLTLDDRSAGGSSPAHGLVLSLLADLMRDVEPAVLLPAGSRIAGDIGSLAGIDLRGNALAAANMEGRNANSGFGVLHGASLRGAQAGRAEEFRRQAYQRHTFVFGPNPCVFCPTPGRWHPHACRRMPNPSCCTGQTRSSRRTDGMSREASVDATGIACQRREAIGCNVSDVAS